jgi:PBP1b-binding outer membrane lipoprotein LpoB
MSYLEKMKRAFLPMIAIAIFLSGCAGGDLTPEQTDKPPAPYAPDPTRHIPQTYDSSQPRI